MGQGFQKIWFTEFYCPTYMRLEHVWIRVSYVHIKGHVRGLGQTLANFAFYLVGETLRHRLDWFNLELATPGNVYFGDRVALLADSSLCCQFLLHEWFKDFCKTICFVRQRFNTGLILGLALFM